MPILLHHPQRRRDFLKLTLLGGASCVLAGCRGARSVSGTIPDFHLALLSEGRSLRRSPEAEINPPELWTN